uniref:Uncharacterized protein LOC117362036 n=1 Tax=Geotrypetes seraphini TaxID=260995 RepID=A0A6P8R1A0_GEOSA|nr:uncharacterized protein LOC117362036 [Geotrypetes seraphini]
MRHTSKDRTRTVAKFSDAAVAVLTLHTSRSLHCVRWFCLGSKYKPRYRLMQHAAENLGPTLRSVLPGLRSRTADNNSTSVFSGLDKHRCLQMLYKSSCCQYKLQQLEESGPPATDAMVDAMHVSKNTERMADGTRLWLLCHKQDHKNLPLTSNSLMCCMERITFQGLGWKMTLHEILKLQPLKGNGWQVSDRRLSSALRSEGPPAGELLDLPLSRCQIFAGPRIDLCQCKASHPICTKASFCTVDKLCGSAHRTIPCKDDSEQHS